jgi:hypothetical protein
MKLVRDTIHQVQGRTSEVIRIILDALMVIQESVEVFLVNEFESRLLSVYFFKKNITKYG